MYSAQSKFPKFLLQIRTKKMQDKTQKGSHTIQLFSRKIPTRFEAFVDEIVEDMLYGKEVDAEVKKKVTKGRGKDVEENRGRKEEDVKGKKKLTKSQERLASASPTPSNKKSKNYKKQ